MISIITPTINRSSEILERCILSVDSQTFKDFEHIIISDTYLERTPMELCSKYNNNRYYHSTNQPPSRTWGAYPRQYALNNIVSKDSKYCVFLDDDNILFPHYLEKMFNTIENGLDAVICPIIHLGPLSNKFFNSVPNIVKGNPPVLQNIDTLNVIVKTEIIKEIGWICEKDENGYCNDGLTYEKLFKNIKYGYVDEILAVHL